MEKAKLSRVLADIPVEEKKRLYKVLIDEDLTFNQWIRQQLIAYVEARDPKTRRKRKEG